MSTLKGGKTPPRLLQDLNLYNPDRLPSNSYNILTELAFAFDDRAKPPPKTVKGACKHTWAVKSNACTSELVDASEPALAIVGAVCIECRNHVSVELDSRGEGRGVKPCPTKDNPLHHFRYFGKRSQGFQRTGTSLESWEDTRLFQCSVQACSARLTVRMRSPRLMRPFRDLLLDRDLINERARRAMDSDPERFEGHAVPSPLTVMGNLKSYLSTAMAGNEKRIAANNKKWLLSLGEPCAELLEYLHFKKNNDEWTPPKPEAADREPFSTDLKILLDDVDCELTILMRKQPEEEKRSLKLHLPFRGATMDFQRLLGCHDYKQSLASRTILQNGDDEHPFYAGLGTVLDFDDSLIAFAYTKQCECDPSNIPYYLECLQGIARGRSSEDLDLKATLEVSTGKASLRDIREAYTSFGLDEYNSQLLDDHIIGCFRSRISDAPRQEADLRRKLKIIGQHRRSSKIEEFASDTVSTYEQALAWLNGSDEMDDSFITSMYAVKLNENPKNEKIARECVSMIAKKRGSENLRRFLETGRLGESEMDVGQAYARFDISDRTIDDEFVANVFKLGVQDTPAQATELKRALAAIAKDRNSSYLKSLLNMTTTRTHNLAEWPVGLENIGNTCYLNSLLQFYFTVRPLRDLVLNFDDYRVKFDQTALEKKKVGSRHVSKREVERAQRFVLELQKLFQNMISSNTASIEPEIELARLTLLSESTEESYRRKSTLQGQRPSLGEIQGKPIHGPQPAPISEDIASENQGEAIISGENQIVQSPTTAPAREEEVSSDCTLVEKPSPVTIDLTNTEDDPPTNALADKENMAPSKTEAAHSVTPESPLKPLTSASQSRINEQQTPQHPTGSHMESENAPSTSEASTAIPAPPTRSPPPVPPRNRAASRREEIKKEVEFGAQQDVTEVISNVLFQLQCAIEPESIDESGEQIDKIKDLFFGKLKVTTTAKDGKARTKEEFFSDIKLQVSSRPCDIYEALDGAFDEQDVEVGTSKEPQYTSISMIPPILQFHVSRAHYDKEKRETFKANHHLDFKETIFMDRYMDEGDAALQQRRAECWDWKKTLRWMEKRVDYLEKTEIGTSMAEALKCTSAYLTQSQEDSDAPEETRVVEELSKLIADAAKRTNKELEDLKSIMKTTKTKIDSQFTDLRSLPYNLHSVIIHRGTVGSGHYWIYAYDFAQKVWRKYNDGYVTKVDNVKEIFETEDSARPPTSSFLVYVKEGKETKLTDAVYRKISEPEVIQLDGSGDVQMLDARSDSPMEKLSRWSTDLGRNENVATNETGGLVRPPQFEGHKGVTW